MTLRGHSRVVSSIAFGPDGKKIISGGLDGSVRVWDAETGAELITFRVYSLGVNSVAFRPDGRRIIAGGPTIKIWDSARPQEVTDKSEVINSH